MFWEEDLTIVSYGQLLHLFGPNRFSSYFKDFYPRPLQE